MCISPGGSQGCRCPTAVIVGKFPSVLLCRWGRVNYPPVSLFSEKEDSSGGIWKLSASLQAEWWERGAL